MDKLVASDDFARADTTNGWGAPKVGGSYAFGGQSAFSIESKRGVMKIPLAATSRTAAFGSAVVTDGSMTAQFSIPALPTKAGGLRVAVNQRQQGALAYRATATIDPAGAVVLSVGRIDDASGKITTLGSAAVPVGAKEGTRFMLDLRVTGQSPVVLSSRLYLAGGTAPDWQATANDSSDQRIKAAGTAGVWAYTSSGSSGATLSFEKLALESLKQEVTPTVPPVTVPPVTVPPVTTPTVPAPTVPAPAAPVAGVLAAGSPVVGSTSYAVPSTARFVAPGGSDSNPGTKERPVRSLARAIALAPSKSAIVMRAGSYHESVSIPDAKTLTIQSYPKEQVWLDGSESVTGFVQSGSTWVKSKWTTQFDHSPTFSRGKPDNTKSGWQFVNPSYPMAPYPDQVFINGASLKQVASAAKVAVGTFYVDEAGDRLIIGDNPSSKDVRASTLQRALTIRSQNTVIQGIGIRRYAPSMPDMGAVRVDDVAKNVTFNDVMVTENSTSGMSAVASGLTLNRSTFSRNGFIGLQMAYVDGLKASSILVENNNTENFNYTPAAGGFKIGRARNISVDSSIFRDNKGIGLWFDESTYNVSVTNSTITGNLHHGLMFELSEKIVAANNYVANNAQAGIKLFSAGGAQFWNNTVVGNKRDIDIVQDKRVASDTSAAGHDPRQPLPDPTVPWLTRNITVGNNILGNPVTGTDCMLCIADNLNKSTGQQLNIVVTGNLVQRPSATAPKIMFRWPNGAAGTSTFNSLADFARGSGQKVGYEYNGPMDAVGSVSASVLTAAKATTTAPPAAIASVTRITSSGVIGSTHR